KVRAEQEMVEAQSGIAAPAISHVVPEGVDSIIRVNPAECIRPAAADQPPECRTALRLDQGIIVPGAGWIYIEIRGGHVEVASQHHRSTGFSQCRGVVMQ